MGISNRWVSLVRLRLIIRESDSWLVKDDTDYVSLPHYESNVNRPKRSERTPEEKAKSTRKRRDYMSRNRTSRGEPARGEEQKSMTEDLDDVHRLKRGKRAADDNDSDDVGSKKKRERQYARAFCTL
jgi:hypothetical protein